MANMRMISSGLEGGPQGIDARYPIVHQMAGPAAILAVECWLPTSITLFPKN
jgi:hypothetical protein